MPPGMRMPIMGPGGEPFNGHDGDFFPMQGGNHGQRRKFLTFNLLRSSWNGSTNDTTKRSWRPNGSRWSHGSWSSHVWTDERTSTWRTHATYIKHGSRGSKASMASRWSRSDVTLPPPQSWLRRTPSWSRTRHPYHGLSKRTCQWGRPSLHDEERANVRGEWRRASPWSNIQFHLPNQESGPGSSGGEGGPQVKSSLIFPVSWNNNSEQNTIFISLTQSEPQNGGPDLDNMKSSPTTAPTTPREGDQNLEFNMPNFPPGGENVSSHLESFFVF